MSSERTEPQQGASTGAEDRLKEEHELDEAALARALPDGAAAPTERLPAAVPGAPGRPPAGGGLRRRTLVLLAVVAGGLLFLAGIQCQKLTGGGPGPRNGQAPAGSETVTSAQPAAPDPRIVHGEIVALRGTTLYVREGDGDVVRMQAGGASRVYRGRAAGVAGVRPGERVVAEVQPGDAGEPTAISLTVLPPRERRP